MDSRNSKNDNQIALKKTLDVLIELRNFFRSQSDYGEIIADFESYNECLKKAHPNAELCYKKRDKKHVLYVNNKLIDDSEIAADEISNMIDSLSQPIKEQLRSTKADHYMLLARLRRHYGEKMHLQEELYASQNTSRRLSEENEHLTAEVKKDEEQIKHLTAEIEKDKKQIENLNAKVKKTQEQSEATDAIKSTAVATTKVTAPMPDGMLHEFDISPRSEKRILDQLKQKKQLTGYPKHGLMQDRASASKTPPLHVNMGIDESLPFKLIKGFSVGQIDHRWTDGTEASLIVPQVQGKHIKQIVFETHGMVSDTVSQSLEVTIEGIGQQKYKYNNSTTSHTIKIDIPANYTDDIKINFQIPDACLARWVDPYNKDDRVLGIQFTTAKVYYDKSVVAKPTSKPNVSVMRV